MKLLKVENGKEAQLMLRNTHYELPVQVKVNYKREEKEAKNLPTQNSWRARAGDWEEWGRCEAEVDKPIGHLWISRICSSIYIYKSFD